MKKVTRRDLLKRKAEGQKIVVLTAYDWSTARLADSAGVDALLVGDSLGMVIQGHDSTLPVTLDDMVYHTRCVARARPSALIVADLPFGTCQCGPAKALEASIRLVQEGRAEAVKLEGGGERIAAVEAVVRADIPVWGHLGLTPQSIHSFGGYKVQGKSDDAAAALRADAKRLEDAGISALVLECIPLDLAETLQQELSVPTIGIGAGPHCDGQVLVFHDVLGLLTDFTPKFVKRYAETGSTMIQALTRFVSDVKSGAFPSLEQSYGVKSSAQRKGKQ